MHNRMRIGLVTALVAFAAGRGTGQPMLDTHGMDVEQRTAALSGLRVAAGKGLTVELWVRGDRTGEATQAILGTKSEADAEAGWIISADASGSWHWNVGDGRRRLDYQPTAARQPLFDDRTHRIAMVVRPQRGEARLFFDGVNVAVYAMSGIDPANWPDRIILGGRFLGSIERVRIWPGAVDDGELIEAGEEAAQIRRSLRVMAWNIWHGGRENGSEAGVQQVIDVIRDSQADIICMQETYGSGPRIADALGFHFYLRSSNLSIMSRFPIGETSDIFRPFNSGLAVVHLPGGLDVNVGVIWLNYLPDVDELTVRGQGSVGAVIEAEQQTRTAEIEAILRQMQPVLRQAEEMPVLLAGDFNSLSHLDRNTRAGGAIPWPVSTACVEAGLIDAYRAIHPDAADEGLTWSPRFGMSSRIDYVYYRGSSLEPIEAAVIDTHAPRFPSDHAAVLVTFRIGE